ncbi:hypothetical protein M9978_21855 [Sphingomonas sp. MG17]|jgi:hypothetical protein|uniref:Uncharacterized protein n=1 Tax=Sphingomonas tagetis TaxID=2949092 RepID=A0A9X2HRG7_9SPHN|nr:hypothetical protein [Sphingomonas tagetis]MCP3733056.1 hypothetical protein [Sphingomonas tagetis]
MKPTAITCRAQQAHHLALAAAAVLPNVRGIATLAAAAWGKEALDADKRDTRAALRKQGVEEAALALRLELPAQDDRRFSENPDRGFADQGPILN